MITTKQVKDLREKTGVSIMQCKKALEEAKGDVERALVLLRKHSGDIASKKADRVLGAGVVQAYIHATKDIGAMVALACETDFVSKNEEFSALARDIAMHVTATNPGFLRREDIDTKTMEAAKAVFADEVKNKPGNLKDKILQGKLDAYFKDKILLEQPFVKDEEKSVGELIDIAIQKFGEKIEVTDFIRFSIR
jgi:elongation factor Ts